MMQPKDRIASPLRVALVCGNAYPQFDSGVPPVGGGMESRAALFARGLATDERWRVCFVVSDFGQPFETVHEGIDFYVYQPVYRRAGRNVFPRLRKRKWFPVLNLDRRDVGLVWQIPLIAVWLAAPALFSHRFWQSLKPDVVCCFGNNEQTAEAIADCRRVGIRAVLCVANDRDLSADYSPGNHTSDHNGMLRWRGHYSLTHADRIVVQSESQRDALRQHFGREGILIRNPVYVSPDDPKRWMPRAQREFVLWIGRTDNVAKRPMLFLQLARECPGLAFVMIVSRTDETTFQALRRAKPENLRIVEHIPPNETWDYVRRARVFVNTSQFEGFPNTFLQSAVMGVPIVSLEVDPDGILTLHGCGFCAAGDSDAMRKAVVDISLNDVRADTLATANHRYVLERHAAKERITELEQCLRELAEQDTLSIAVPRWVGLRRFA